MSRLLLLLGLAGLGVAIALLAHAGLPTVLAALAAAGWPLLWLVPLHILPLALDASGWRVLLAPRDPEQRARLPVLLAAACVREAVSRLLPVAGMGGELVGVRIVSRRGLPVTPVAATVITEVVLTLTSVLVFMLLGIALLVMRMGGSTLVTPVLWGVVLALPVPLTGHWLIQEGRIAAWLARLARRFGGELGAGGQWQASIPALEAELAALARRRGRLLATLLLQLSGMIAGAAEVWLALRLLGHPVGVVPAIIIESLVVFVRNLAFAVPGALGAQEAAIAAICAALGLGQDVALGLALAKRMRELLFGVPALLGWQLWEGALGLRARKPKPEEIGKPL